MLPSAHSAAQAPAGTLPPGARAAELEPLVAHVEDRLGALADSLRERDVQAIERQAQELHRALAHAVERFMHAARHGGVPEPMRLRLARASAQLARQREALARATAALDRALDVLLPGSHNPATPNLYGPAGGPSSRNGLAGLQA
jgi:exonuclease VII large subunit